MKLKLLSAAVVAALGCVSSSAWAGQLGLDTNCNDNGTDQGTLTWNGATYRRCDLPSSIVYSGTVSLPKSVNSTNILWAMPTVVTVGDGHEAGKTPSTATATVLSITAGAKLVGAIGNSALVITRGARITASGNSSNPIEFSSLDSNYTGTGEWGGLILSSWDNTNECNTGSECTMEGISDGQFYYGGYIDETQTASWDNVSSGTLNYVVIAEGGHAVNIDIDGDPDENSNTGDEINGLTLYGVSSETTISNIHIHNNDDDGIEFFGGDIDVNKIWITCAGDDSVDWDFGFNGLINQAYILQKDGADHAFELANNPNNSAATPVANGSVSYVTLAFVDSTPNVDTPFDLKQGTDGTFSTVEIGSAYTGACFSSGATDAVSSSDFSSFEYACTDNLNLLPATSSVTGFTTSTFWASYPGTCD